MNSDALQQEFARVASKEPLKAIDLSRYEIQQQPEGEDAKDPAAWRKAAKAAQMQLEYNRLKLTNLEMLERWGGKAWIAHSAVVRATERSISEEVAGLRAGSEEVNKKRKLDQVTCGNELRRLQHDLDRYRQDNMEVENGLLRTRLWSSDSGRPP